MGERLSVLVSKTTKRLAVSYEAFRDFETVRFDPVLKTVVEVRMRVGLLEIAFAAKFDLAIRGGNFPRKYVRRGELYRAFLNFDHCSTVNTSLTSKVCLKALESSIYTQLTDNYSYPDTLSRR